jgi:hypothetical protein
VIWLRALSFIPLALAARVRQVERRTIARLTDAGASRMDRAILLEREGPVAGFVHHRLVRAGVLKGAANDRYYWDELAYRELIRRRHRRAMIVGGSLVLMTTMIYLAGLSGTVNFQL